MLDVPQTQIHRDFNVHDIDEKLKSTNLYNHSIQIIELVECPPPPRRVADISYAASSSYASSSCTSEAEEELEEDDDEALESYCSSEDPVEYSCQHLCDNSRVPPQHPSDSYSFKMNRILAWRKNFSCQLGSTLSEPSLSSSLKRKEPSYYGDEHDDGDHGSQSSKRSRSHSSEGESSSSSSLGSLSCPACDAFFDDLQSLRQHGRDAKAGANEACFTAVAYAFE